MAAQTNGHPVAPDPKEVGNAFIEQYYTLLHSAPDHVHKFYQEGSVLSRPTSDGEMTTVSTMQGINEMIVSLKYENYKVDILSADAQASYKGGISVLVAGVLMGKDGTKRMFTQSFFLAPQNVGYYVLNDLFRFVEEKSAAPVSLTTCEDISKAPEASEAPEALESPVDSGALLTPEPEDSDKSVEENVPVKEVSSNGEEIKLNMENDKDSVPVMETFVESSTGLSTNDASDCAAASPVVQGDGSKKSFASIVSALKSNSAPFQVRAALVKVVEKPPAPAIVPDTPVQPVPNDAISSAEKISSQAVKRHSVFVGNLPLDATEAQLEAAFKRFGSIKSNGIQVRSSKGSCYGFVEFESESSMLSALEETSILIGNRTAHIEEQKNDGDKGKPQQGRSVFRGDNFRGRGNFNGGRGYGRRDFDRKFDFASRNNRNGGAAFHRGYQNGSGRTPPSQVVE
ncbi:hypothetical protein SAY87_016025 [Trapa incisa]|uniref:Uncharacterized protein n=1 Tax=Trapa incisa TaxID=236973 RepID=A0AAN7L8H8_9MYRT|nr:hypothetical protein SAY87_016025 [Trapa incisa]